MHDERNQRGLQRFSAFLETRYHVIPGGSDLTTAGTLDLAVSPSLCSAERLASADDSVGVRVVTVRRREHRSFGHARAGTLAEEGRTMHMATKLKRWTLDEVHSLPDDGNKYELVRGDLFVTPPPTDDHETILARLSDALSAYVRTQGIGLVYHPRAVLRFRGSEAEPDLMVRPPSPRKRTSWEKVPRPSLVVEVHSDTTRRRDRVQKKEYYAEAGVAEYWMIDPEERVVTVAGPGRADRVVSDVLTWNPVGANEPFSIGLDELFA